MKSGESVYLVTEGEYSDYSVVAAFSTEALAREFIAANRNGDVEVFAVDEMVGTEDRECWLCTLSLLTGEIVNETCEHRLVGAGWRGWHYVGIENVSSISPVNAEHARKLAAEARQAYLRKVIELHSVPT